MGDIRSQPPRRPPDPVDYFLKIDGIQGESQDSKLKGAIEIESFSWGLSNPGSASHGGGGGAGKPSFQDFSFVARASRASPKLFFACASGQHFPEAKLTARKAGKDQQEFMVITLTGLLVSNYEQAGDRSSEALPTDQFSLNFAKVEFEYRPQKPDGSLDSSVIAAWDLKTNTGGR